MRTLIEILDYEQTENIISPLVFDFDQVIYLYDRHHDYQRKRRTLHELLARKKSVQVKFVQAPDDCEELFASLSASYPDAVFNCSNGSRTLLVKMARFCEKTSQRCYTLNFQRKSFQNLGGCEDMKSQFTVPHLSVKDIISLSSGEIVKTSHALPKMNDEMKADMKNIIHVMNSDSSAFSKLLSAFAKNMREQMPDDTTLVLDLIEEKDQLQLLKKLAQAKIVHNSSEKGKLHLCFKNQTLMKMMSDSGAWLEYQSYLECTESGFFDDVRISTVVDWNADSSDKNDPTCEIDLIVVKNCIPVFVSCKLNKCSALDLYEIKLLSQKLGGTLGKAAVISKAYALHEGEPLALKAKELGITLIDGQDIEKGRIAQKLLSCIR